MSTEIVIPALGESITEGVISAWLKADGEWADRDEPVLELETDKITTEIPAPASGVVHHTVGEGETVEIGGAVGAIDESANKPAGASKQDAPQASAPATPSAHAEPASSVGSNAARAATTAPSSPGAGVAPNSGSGVAPVEPSADDHTVSATPLARKIARDHGISLTGVAGTGPGGRIREQDVIAFIQTHPNGAATASATPTGGTAVAPIGSVGGPSRAVTRERMSPLRQRIAARLVEAQQTAAMLTTFNECDMTNVMALRKRHKETFEKKHGVGLGFMSFFVKACVSALQRVPNVNARIGTNAKDEPEIIRHGYMDIAVAVGTPKGLVVPVVRNCESLTFAGVESAIRDLATRARDGKLTLEEMQGGTFTISNGGVYGSMMSTPILNPPQSGILGMHNIVRRPVEDPQRPGSGEVAVRPMMYLALSYDHRLVDGGGAVTFLKHVKECIEDPERLLLDV